ncbi:MAG TPA: 50S ribosomal protein L6 [Candidatus Saccharimonadales bacterium]|nr:50S ribosomal protein L6 [Candidatus Saccharimonadales bacterium]
MSRIGKMPVVLPKGVSLKVSPASVEVKGPKGVLTSPLPPGISCSVEEGRALIRRRAETKRERAFHGLARALLANAVKGVSEGFSRQLELQGIGYKAQVQGKKLELALGFSHPVVYPIPEGIAIAVDAKAGRISISGNDKQQVGQVAAEIRGLKPPEPYKGKGIRYAGEQIKKKVGKTGA